ncbi:MAG TPA: NUDIX hydrolase [Candidatus Saccharimonadia bacterium]|nr:NUDIX hydrolase [Candidatus Saccharimonadia bacterium]
MGIVKKLVVVKALVFNAKDEVLLVQRGETAPRRPLQWDLPGGFVDDDDESYQQACLREVHEETGLSLENDHVDLAFAESKYGDFHGTVTDVSWLYFTGLAPNNDVRLSHEHVAYRWVSLTTAQELITYDTQLRALKYIAELRAITANE